MPNVAVDANCVAQYQRERLGLCRGAGSAAFQHILADHQIVLDDGKLCEQEWFACLEGPIGENLRDHVADLMRQGKVVPIACQSQPRHRAALRQLGFPSSDQKWVNLVISSRAVAMVSEDIDFYDPSRKNSPDRVKTPIKVNQRGPVARYFRRIIGAPVMMLQHVPAQL